MPQAHFGEKDAPGEKAPLFVPYADSATPMTGYELATDVNPVRFETEQVEMSYRPTLYLAQYTRDHGLRGDIALELNMRLSSPLGNIVLLLLGLPFVLRRNLKSPFLAVLIAIAITGAYFALGLVAATFAQEGRFLTPLTGAWAPIIVFGPVAVLLFDTVES
jgi:lipopolysaccharide export LptBFGC system permease protein LptF